MSPGFQVYTMNAVASGLSLSPGANGGHGAHAEGHGHRVSAVEWVRGMGHTLFGRVSITRDVLLNTSWSFFWTL